MPRLTQSASRYPAGTILDIPAYPHTAFTNVT